MNIMFQDSSFSSACENHDKIFNVDKIRRERKLDKIEEYEQ